ncbi:MAG: peptidylprolyl isomerase [Brevundimonas sp.]|uniref:peptidylprolyl isomerase n=1 Tax=Brevundimonas sp. TaxID=1871086 RepID=UPI002736B32F|nr:peptidylprolyl isomerase [Brevundimonas sp.]MDP3403868.1 peptidylprolyl isomerase [Brevundimonas sp.]
MIATTLAAAALVAFPPREEPPVRAVIQTDLGPVTLSLDARNAPVSTCNFLRYARAGQYRDARFFRTVVAATNASPYPIDVIQAETTAGSDDPGLGPIPLERTRDTGLSHVAGTISMARNGPDTATSSFFIVTEDTPALDFGGGRSPDGQGFAAFGQVVEGLDLVRTIQRRPAVNEQLVTPVRITDIVLRSPVPDICAAIFPEAP